MVRVNVKWVNVIILAKMVLKRIIIKLFNVLSILINKETSTRIIFLVYVNGVHLNPNQHLRFPEYHEPANFRSDFRHHLSECSLC